MINIGTLCPFSSEHKKCYKLYIWEEKSVHNSHNLSFVETYNDRLNLKFLLHRVWFMGWKRCKRSRVDPRTDINSKGTKPEERVCECRPPISTCCIGLLDVSSCFERRGPTPEGVPRTPTDFWPSSISSVQLWAHSHVGITTQFRKIKNSGGCLFFDGKSKKREENVQSYLHRDKIKLNLTSGFIQQTYIVL